MMKTREDFERVFGPMTDEHWQHICDVAEEVDEYIKNNYTGNEVTKND